MYQSSVHLVENIDDKASIPEIVIHDPDQENIEPSITVHANTEISPPLSCFEKIMKTIEHYHEVILFGPADPKVELLKLLRSDHRFDHIKVGLEQTEELNEEQLSLFVEKYFSR